MVILKYKLLKYFNINVTVFNLYYLYVYVLKNTNPPFI